MINLNTAQKASPTDTVLASEIWKIADDLRGDFAHTDFGAIILPFTVLRRLECALEPTKDKVLATAGQIEGKGLDEYRMLTHASNHPFYNKSTYTLKSIDPTDPHSSFLAYLAGFSDNVQTIIREFELENIAQKLVRAGLLYRVCQHFAQIDLHPDVISDRSVSNVYEHLIARFGSEVGIGSEDFMTPRQDTTACLTIYV